ncbi:MAG TPA: alpha/beta hydrolase [Vicinamibacterales bacterium]|nr:alpha/beta hydrolase [Vicinamibacterales bacterium]
MDRNLAVLALLLAGSVSGASAVGSQTAGPALEAFSEGAGPPLVMLGGGTLGAGEFAAHARVLAAQYRVVRLQTLNITAAEKRDPLPAAYSVKLESAAMTRSLDGLGLTTALNVVGHSYGALVALDFALDHPDRIRTLVLAEPPAFWIVSPEERASDNFRAIDDLSRTLGPTVVPTDDQFVRFQCALGNCGARSPEPTDPAWKEWAWRRSTLRGLSVVATHTDDVNRLKSFRRPVLIVTGSTTVAFHRRINDLLARSLPQAERAELPGGHGAPAVAQAEFIRLIRTFVGRHVS